MVEAPAAPGSTTQEKRPELGSTEQTGDFLINNLKAQESRKEQAHQAPEQAVDITSTLQEKFMPLQKEGNVENINKFREDVQAAIKEGKKVAPEFLAQLELPVETAEQKQIKELTAQKEAIQKDLKMSEADKAEAFKKLEGTKEKNYWENPEFVESQTNNVVENKNENKDEAYKLHEIKAKQYDDLESDPFIKSYLSAKQTGKQPAEFLSEITTGNPTTLSDEQVLENMIKRSGLDETDAQEERDHFKALSPLAKRELISKERGALTQEYQKNFEKYSTSNAAEAEKTLSIAKQSIKETNDYLQNLNGKEKWGITYDSTQIEKLKDFANDIMVNGGLFKKDGSFDVPKIMQLGMLKLNSQHMLQKAFEKGETTANEKWYEKYGRPSTDNGIARIPSASEADKSQEEVNRQNAEWRKLNASG